MAPRKKTFNAFYYFMLDFKARCERNGDHFPNGLKDVMEDAGMEWDAMSAEAKKKYEDKAKMDKAQARGYDLTVKETCLNNPFEVKESQTSDEEEAKSNMITFIDSMLTALSSSKRLAEFKFYLIHVNYFCVSEEECYYPAELAIAEFSLGEGVTNVYHTIIEPGEIPLRHRVDAMEKFHTHRIPFEYKKGKSDFYKILTDVKKFIQPGTNAQAGEYPPLFTMPDNINLNTSSKAVQSVLYKLCASDPNGYYVKEFRVYPIERLFFGLRNACCKIANKDDEGFETSNTSLLVLEKDVFSFTSEIACSFHQKEDAVGVCSKSYVQRWAYLICDYCCHYLNINLIPGRHVPEGSDVEYTNHLDDSKELETSTHSKERYNRPKEVVTQKWVPVEQPPLPRPTRQANMIAMLPTPAVNQENFPSLQGGGVGIPNAYIDNNCNEEKPKVMSFAAALKKK